jgi:hypothetical protein
MIVRRLAVVLVVAVGALILLTRPGAQKPQVVVQNRPAGPGQQQPSLLSKEQQPPASQAPPPAGQAQAPARQPSFPVSDAVDQALRSRLQEYWRARAKSDLLTAYNFYEPAFRRQYNPQEFLLKFHRLVRFKPEFLGIDRIRFEPGGTTATAFIRLRTRPDVVLNEEVVSVTEEHWLIESGTWWKKAEATLPVF